MKEIQKVVGGLGKVFNLRDLANLLGALDFLIIINKVSTIQGRGK